MNMVLGVILTLWGVLILYSSIFKMKRKKDYEDDTKFGSSGYIEWESLFKWFNKMPFSLAKSLVLIIGTSFVILGAWVI
ncbi:MAG: hypothetical protein ACQEWE_19005 [Bacillota bacterium]